MMNKVVRYNGGKDFYYPCDDPKKVLLPGRFYKVIGEEDRGCQTNYHLQGIDGKFNSIWFDSPKSVYLAVTREEPVVGKKMQLSVLVNDQRTGRLRSWTTHPVQQALKIGKNIYQVRTEKCLYYILKTDEPASEKIFLGLSIKLPCAGVHLNVSVIYDDNGTIRTKNIVTSTCREVLYVGDQIFQVITQNSYYFVKII